MIVHGINNSLTSMPAEMVRKGLFIENAVSLSTMNIVLMVLLMVGFISLVVVLRSPINVKSNPQMGSGTLFLNQLELG